MPFFSRFRARSKAKVELAQEVVRSSEIPIYKYRPLESSDTIRLLHFKPSQLETNLTLEIKHVSLRDHPKYSALSYTWGDLEQEDSILCDGAKLFITRNLHAALKAMVRTVTSLQDSFYWIDQVCIDQKNVEERESQIKLMGDVYKQASRCAAYVGDPSGDDLEALVMINNLSSLSSAAMRRLKAGGDFEYDGLPPADSRAWMAYDRLYFRPWFRRIWVVQEVSLAPEVFVFMGTESVSIDTLLLAYHRAGEIAVVSSYNTLKEEQKRLRRMAGNQLCCIESVRNRIGNGIPRDLYQVLHRCWRSECTDPRDKIYGVFGIITTVNRPKIRVDYNIPVHLLYEDAARYMIESGDGPKVLRDAGIAKAMQGSPSWVPSWTAPTIHTVARGLTGEYTLFYRVDGGRKGEMVLSKDSPVLSVRGVVLDEVVELSDIAHNYNSSPSEDRGFVQRLRSWEEDVAQNLLAQLTSYPDGRPVDDAYWHTLIGGKSVEGRKVDADQVAAYYIAWQSRWDEDYYQRAHRGLEPLDWRNLGYFYQLYRMSAAGRRLCLTEKGYIGLAPENAQLGDKVAILLGMPAPQILRRQGSNFVLVGESYIHGIMQGEAFDLPNTLIEWIPIE